MTHLMHLTESATDCTETPVYTSPTDSNNIFKSSRVTLSLSQCFYERSTTLEMAPHFSPPQSINIHKNHAVEWETPTGPILYS